MRALAPVSAPRPASLLHSSSPNRPIKPATVCPVNSSGAVRRPTRRVAVQASKGSKNGEDSQPEPLEAAESLEAAPSKSAPKPSGKGKKAGKTSAGAGSGGSDSDDGAETTREAVRGAGEQMADAVEDAGERVADAVEDAASDAADAAEALQTVAEDAQEQVADVVDDVASDAADAAASVQAAAEDAGQQVADAVQDAASDAAEAAASAQSSLAAAGQQAVESALEAASDVASEAAGIAGAVQSAAQAVSDKAAQAAAPQPAGPAPPPDTAPIPSTAAGRRKEVAAAKQALLSMLASLDRGAAATEDQVQRVAALAYRLERLGGAVTLSWERPDENSKSAMALLDGRWRLLYSSGFSSGSLGGRRPGPSFGAGPFTLGQVYQDILTERSELNNVVDLFLRYSLAALPGLNAATPTAHATLRHTFRVVGANTLEITYTDTEVKLAGGLAGWLDSLPQFTLPSLPEALRPPQNLRSARFDVVYLDEDMRITRGDRGEIRVFLKGET